MERERNVKRKGNAGGNKRQGDVGDNESRERKKFQFTTEFFKCVLSDFYIHIRGAFETL